MQTVTKRERKREKVSVSLRPDQVQQLRELALKERHENLSLIVQRAVDREIESSRGQKEPVAA